MQEDISPWQSGEEDNKSDDNMDIKTEDNLEIKSNDNKLEDKNDITEKDSQNFYDNMNSPFSSDANKTTRFDLVEKRNECNFCKTQENIWSFLDATYVTCLRDREDRYTKAVDEIHRTGLCQSNIFIFRPERSPLGFVHGCWTSHQEIANHALRANYKIVLDLEDDFELDTKKKVEDISKQIQDTIQSLENYKWNRISLGHISWFSMVYNKYVKRSCTLLTHAQIWSESGLQWMKDHPYDEVSKALKLQVDGFISWNLKFSYAIYPMVAFQRNLGSDRVAHDPLLERDNMEATDIWIPSIWIGGILLFFFPLVFILYRKHVGWKKLVGIPLILFIVPFVLVWILILLNVF